MPRITRALVLADGSIYHVLNRGNGKQRIFHKKQDYEAFIDLLKQAKDKYSLKIYGYCLMPNHFHLLIKPAYGKDLSKCMHWMTTSHVRRYQKHYRTSGHIWQGRFKSFIIQNDEYALSVLRYIEANPVRAGLVDSAEDWPWSSYRDTVGDRSVGLVNQIPIELPRNWHDFVNEPFGQKELEMLRQSTNRQSPYGDLVWKAKIAEIFGLESTIRRPGRPRKRL